MNEEPKMELDEVFTTLESSYLEMIEVLEAINRDKVIGAHLLEEHPNDATYKADYEQSKANHERLMTVYSTFYDDFELFSLELNYVYSLL